VHARALPAGLHLVAGWTGTSAHTTPLLVRFATAPTPAALADLTAVATAAADAVARGDAATLLDAVDRSASLLVRLGNELDLPLVTPALARLVRAAQRVGAAAKPSGAGGGDCGIALATSAAQAAAVRAAWQDAGILPLPVTIAAQGVVVG
jgi:phosphomevalonate kinase